ncbi:MAG: hypothetical protein JST00_33100 [Deltaproteobacteria bacterium]|nr:hypothetical protein [Deltaproteobacteria bacterium]
MTRARASLVFGLVSLVAGASCSDAEPEESASPCIAFAKSVKPSVGVEARPPLPFATVAGVASTGERTYVLGEGRVVVVEAAYATAIDVPRETLAIAVVADDAGTRLYTLATEQTGTTAGERTPRVRRFTSADGGKTFDSASGKILWSGPVATDTPVALAMTAARSGTLFVAVGSNGTTPQHGKIFRFDVRRDAVNEPEAWVVAGGLPVGLSFDDDLGELWASYREVASGFDGVYRVRADLPARAEPIAPIARSDRPDRVPSQGYVVRSRSLARLAGSYVYETSSGLAVVDPHGPSGLAQVSYVAAPAGTLLRDREGDLFVAGGGASFAKLVDTAPAIVAPTSLLASKCFDPSAPLGAVAGAIAYDVNAPLWSDGATKERFVVVPKGGRITQRPDGDLVFPVGTVAVKSFSVDGRRVETRLFVQHDLEDWVGYSYAWNAQGTDAELVTGNRLVDLPGGKRWYYPSTADCSACHTPAAGYTLGLETRQLLGRPESVALDALDAKTPTKTVDRGSVKPLVSLDASAATLEQRARSYLHSNCSVCHREGSIAGSSAMDLRYDKTLAESGLCDEPKIGDLGVKGARLVTPGAPERSVVALRMRALDERRMPKLGSRVVDEAGIAAVEAWIRSLTSCP